MACIASTTITKTELVARRKSDKHLARGYARAPTCLQMRRLVARRLDALCVVYPVLMLLLLFCAALYLNNFWTGVLCFFGWCGWSSFIANNE
jgi:hypothetical protein